MLKLLLLCLDSSELPEGEAVEDAPWMWRRPHSLEAKFSFVNRLVLAGVFHPIPKGHKILSVIPLALVTCDRAPSMCLCPSEC